MAICKSCGLSANELYCRVVVIDTDTGGTLASRPFLTNQDRVDTFTNHYYTLVDSGAYPNRSEPFVECVACRTIRYNEIQEELDYWVNNNSRY